MKIDRMSRRRWLQGAGAMLALPLLPSLFGKAARADVTTQKSFIGIGAWAGLFKMYGPESQLMPATFDGNGALVGLQPLPLPGRHTIHHESLTTLASANGGKISDIIDSSFTPYLSKMLMLQGFDYIALGSNHHNGQFGAWHNTAAMVEGNPSMASLDVVLAEYFAKRGLNKELVAYSASPRDVQTRDYGCSFRADASITSARFCDPATLWEKYFGGASVPTDFKVLLVDQVLEDYKSLRQNPRLGAEDRTKLEAHVAHLAATEAKVKRVAAVCNQLSPASNLSDRSLILRTMNDVIVGLISCGMCNVFMGWAQALLNEDPGQWHTWSHEAYNADDNVIGNPTSYQQMVEQNRAVLKDMCLDLAKKLDDVGQLDNSLIVWIQEHNNRGHDTTVVPVITFGSAGGVFRTNRHVDFRNLGFQGRFGFPMNQLYANILDAMGMPAAEFQALNRTRSDTTSPFKRESGYGVNAIHPDFGPHDQGMGLHYSSWSGYDLSSPLPVIRY